MAFTKFDELNVCGELLFALQDMGFESPTAVQAEVIPIILDKKDVLATAPTGTGKTCAFGIPTIEKIDKLLDKTQALVVCPTRELAMQITEELKRLAKHIKEMRIVSVYGGENISKQIAHLRRKPQIVVGTPGRIMDHLRRKTLKLDMLTTLILDEADEMLNMGFREDIEVIAKACPKYRQTVMFSATMPKEIETISQCYQTNPEKVKIERKNEDMPKIKQVGIRATSANKDAKLLELLNEVDFNLAVIFSNTKRRVDKIKADLKTAEYRCDGLHSDIRQNVRTKIMKRFRSGEIQVLIATDVAARGIDVENVDLIINYDLPQDEEYYVHRIGRTGRAKKEGVAYSFYAKDDVIRMNKYAKVTGGNISLDPEDVIENIDDYSVRTGRIMQPKKKSGGRGRGGRSSRPMRGMEEGDVAVSEDNNSQKSNRGNRGDRKRNENRDDSRGDNKRRDNNRGERQEKQTNRFENMYSTFEASEESAPREERKPRGDRKPREDRSPRGDRKPRQERAPRGDRKPREERAPREARNPRQERAPREERKPDKRAYKSERKGNIDSYGEKAPTKKKDAPKFDASFKPKKGITKGGKPTTFGGKQSTNKHAKKLAKKK